MRRLLSLLLVFLIATSAVFAQSDTASFNVRVFGAEDDEAPTTPTLTATAVAYDEVSVSWTVATDNYLISGYVLYRDGLPLSTTTQTSYSDIGLTASTTYTYSVRAFDPSFNYSSSSNLVSVMTPEEPVDPPEGNDGSNQSTSARIVLNELTIIPGVSTSTFFIKTARPARFEMRWGRTDAYELGYVVNNRFVDNYETTLTDLEPGTTYVYEVIGYTPYGKATVLEQGQFTTLNRSEFLPPANVSRFTALRDETDARLSWLNPVSSAFASVRIVRSHLGFPTHPQDGAVVYQGTGQSFVDEDILNQYSPVYYTAFVFDVAGNVSSGAIARVYAEGESGPIASPVPTPGGSDETVIIDDAFASTSPNIPQGAIMPDLSQILLVQDGAQTSFAEPKLTLTATKDFTISIPKEAVSINLKSIIATLTDPTDSRKTYSVLLRLNKDKTAYEAVIAPLMVEGVSQITVDIYDYHAFVVGTYRKTVTFIAGKAGSREVPIFPDLFIQKGLPVLLMVALPILLGMLLLYFYRRRHPHREDNH